MDNFWISLNKNCNLRCKWCSKVTNGYNNEYISFQNLKKIIDYASKKRFKKVVLSGGEPTLYKELYNAISYIKGKGLKSTLITNALLLSDYNNILQLKNSGIDFVSASIKGFSEDEYSSNTGSSAYKIFLNAVNNLQKSNIKFSVSFVLNSNNILCLPQVLRELKSYGAENFFFNFEYAVNYDKQKEQAFKEKNNPFLLILRIKEMYSEICNITNNKIKFSTHFPYCIWDNELVEKMVSKNQISFCCPICVDKSIYIESDLSFNICNGFNMIKYGQLNNYFSDDDIDKIIYGKTKENCIKKIKALPSKRCLICQYNCICSGGCSTFYTHWNLDEILEEKENGYKSSMVNIK